MSAKKIDTKIPHMHPGKAAQEKKQSRMIVIGFIVTAALIVGFSGYALLYELVLKDNIPVAKVDGTRVDNEYFKDRVRMERNSYIQQYQLIYAQYQMLGEDPSASDYYLGQLTQIQQLLDSKEILGELVLNKIIDDEVTAKEADDMDITIANDEIETEIRKLFNFYPEGTPTPVPTATVYSTPTLTSQQENLLNYTPTPIQIDTGLLEESIEQESEIESGESLAGEETPAEEDSALTSTETAVSATGTPVPTSTPYTEDLYQENYRDYMGNLKAVNIKESSFRNYIYHYLLNRKVKEEITKAVPREQEQVWARHILVKTKSEASVVLSRLNEGEVWGDIAVDISLDTSNKNNGGDLGWFTRGRMVSAFEQAAFALNAGDISEPVETEFGWHIIQVIGHEVRPLSDQEHQTAKELEFNNWLESRRASYEVQINDVWKDLVPADPAIPK